jgi:S-ribosylhomocysteine lyase LuxS involved in autoinducer biosynthesis
MLGIWYRPGLVGAFGLLTRLTETNNIDLGGQRMKAQGLLEDSELHSIGHCAGSFAMVVHHLMAAQTDQVDMGGRVGFVMGMVGTKIDLDNGAQLL